MSQNRYLMESEEESIRLELKTDPRAMRRQARWAGIQKGMRVGDLGCGSGKTTYNLNRLVQPGGFSLGIDISPRRIGYAQDHYKAPGLDFALGDIRTPLEPHGSFDFIWIRFVLEYYRSAAFDIVRNVCSVLRPGGILCLVDLDYNCLTHFGLSPALERAMKGVMNHLEENADFDPYIGRKLYSYLYDLGFSEIRVDLSAHHLIYGPIKRNDFFNWVKKIEIAGRQSGYEFKEFHNGFEGFYAEFKAFFCDPRRFTYTPVILCRGKKPY
ncbi:MAG: methyltransferase type 11 [Deltaproteobacteria bacterium HGW-Deltaproteobacteria-21]|nr:MAG: methyltransferase type 11 [Deltaproteobacteria bacterium HGW-Deltaproteobacteria-21]